MLRASCCCGAVTFEVGSLPSMLATCHCSRCRKLGASPFVFVQKSSINLVAGEDEISVYEPAPPFHYPRSFCRRCGTSLGEIISEAEMIPIPANCFDDELQLSNAFHEFVAAKPGWSVIGDDSPQFAGHPEKVQSA